MTGGWFSQGTPDSTNKTDHHDIAEILLNVALNTINQLSHQRHIGPPQGSSVKSFKQPVNDEPTTYLFIKTVYTTICVVHLHKIVKCLVYDCK